MKTGAVDKIQDSIIADFSRLNDGLEKYEYLVNLGRKLPPVNRTDGNLIPGCQYRVWLALPSDERSNR